MKWIYQKRLAHPPWALCYSAQNHQLTFTLFSEAIGNLTQSKTYIDMPYSDFEDGINVILDAMRDNGINWNFDDVEQLERAMRL